MLRKLDHLVITTADIAACTAFYRALGFTARNAGSHWELFAGDFKINVHYLGAELEPKAEQVQPGSADLCFELAIPLEETLRSLKNASLAVELGPVARQGTHGLMQSIYLRDPDGNLIELCSYAG